MAQIINIADHLQYNDCKKDDISKDIEEVVYNAVLSACKRVDSEQAAATPLYDNLPPYLYYY